MQDAASGPQTELACLSDLIDRLQVLYISHGDLNLYSNYHNGHEYGPIHLKDLYQLHNEIKIPCDDWHSDDEDAELPLRLDIHLLQNLSKNQLSKLRGKA